MSPAALFCYVAMFDELDEGTAVFKTAATQAALPRSSGVCVCVCVCVCVHMYIDIYLCIYVYIYICVCVCVCVQADAH